MYRTGVDIVLDYLEYLSSSFLLFLATASQILISFCLPYFSFVFLIFVFYFVILSPVSFFFYLAEF